MEITEVRIKLMGEASERLQAFCSITFDNSFVIRDLKIIDGAHGPFVAMPSRKLTAYCPACGCKNHLRAAHCNQCGGRLNDDRSVKDEDGRATLYADIAHPINSACREMIQQRVIREFQLEQGRSALPGYRSRYDDYDHNVDFAPAGAEGRAQNQCAAATRTTRQVQPAEPQPRSPHKAPSRQTVQHATHSGSAQQGSTRDNSKAGSV